MAMQRALKLLERSHLSGPFLGLSGLEEDTRRES
jgi:hypothetical protein